VLASVFPGRAFSQCDAETVIGGLKTAMDFLAVEKYGFIELIQRRLDGLNLQHAIGNNFTLKFA
jgi:hypothetical protein